MKLFVKLAILVACGYGCWYSYQVIEARDYVKFKREYDCLKKAKAGLAGVVESKDKKLAELREEIIQLEVTISELESQSSIDEMESALTEESTDVVMGGHAAK